MARKQSTCPVCNGTKRKPANNTLHKEVLTDYDSLTDSLPCTNCGGQYSWGKATGTVRVRADGTPCVHSYLSASIGRGLTSYQCRFCSDSFEISSDD